VKQDSRYLGKEMQAGIIEKFLKQDNDTNLNGEIKSEAI
jgi:hypothetical protein